jgi:rRNA maturation endonuclease Nob1
LEVERAMIFMCSTYVPFEIKPEELAAKGREYGMFWCISCKKTFLKKGATECPICGSTKTKPRAP